MSHKLGMEGKLFRNAGTYAIPDWKEMKNVKDLTLTLEKGEADLTTRGNAGWKATVGTLKEGSIEFEMVWDTEDAGFTAIKSAYFGNSLIGLAVMDGPIETSGNQGLWADCMITNFSRDEALEEAITVKVTAKPTYSTNAPHWKTVGP